MFGSKTADCDRYKANRSESGCEAAVRRPAEQLQQTHPARGQQHGVRHCLAETQTHTTHRNGKSVRRVCKTLAAVIFNITVSNVSSGENYTVHYECYSFLYGLHISYYHKRDTVCI